MSAAGASRPAAPLLDGRVAALAVFAIGLALTVFLSLSADDPAYARAKYSIWPVVALGGWAVALMLRHGFTPALDATHWRVWWAGGLLAYALHLYWGFGVIYGASFRAVYAGQGALVASANFGLFALWLLSASAAFARLPALWLHLFAAALFVVATLAATILFGRDISPVGGVIVLLLWLAALYLRLPERRT